MGQVFIPRGKVQIPAEAVIAGDIEQWLNFKRQSTGDTYVLIRIIVSYYLLWSFGPSYSVALTAKSRG